MFKGDNDYLRCHNMLVVTQVVLAGQPIATQVVWGEPPAGGPLVA